MRQYLKELRAKKKISQRNIAGALGISQNYYSQIENGIRKASIDLDLLIKLSNFFEVDLEYLIEQERAISDKKGA